MSEFTLLHDQELKMIQELLWEDVDSIVDGIWHENYGDKDLSVRDAIVTQICDAISEAMDT
tara:strand:- start:21 stop:203 length:183 start_codon:yes stop_codon:yes gene_type:complete